MDLFITRRGGGSGSGGSLNFSVVGGTTQPANPAENTIWVNTSVEIGAWYALFNEPESPQNGDVWVKLSASSFDVDISGNGTMVVEISNITQYISGAWTQYEAWIYRNGAWEEIVLNELVLLDEGGWKSGLSFRSVTDRSDITINNDVYPVTLFMYRYSGAYIPDIDFTDFDTLEFDFEIKTNDKLTYAVSDTTTYSTSTSDALVATRKDGEIKRGLYTLDVSAISGKHNIKICAWGISGTLNIYSIKLKKNGA